MLADRNLEIAEAVSQVASDIGTTPTAVAIAWVLGRRGVTSVIIGPRTFGQYAENMEGFSLILDRSVVHRLNEVSRPMDQSIAWIPGPGDRSVTWVEG